jgi:hypothetical protein
MGLALLIVLLSSVTVLANQGLKAEGVIWGVNCVHNKTTCPEDRLDAHIALEHHFLLVSGDGEHFLLPK